MIKPQEKDLSYWKITGCSPVAKMLVHSLNSRGGIGGCPSRLET